MSQPPIETDGVLIQPTLAPANSRLINANQADGSLLLADGLIPSGITLSQLASLRAVDAIRIVGKAGAGAQYTSIQDAVNSIPSTAKPPLDGSPNPFLILVLPGVYQENVTIEHDGVMLLGLGGAVIDAAIADATVKVQISVTETPTYFVAEGLTIKNTFDGEECLLLSGGALSDVGSNTIQIRSCDLIAAGVGTRQIVANTIGKIEVFGGDWRASSASSLSIFEQCAEVFLDRMRSSGALQITFDSALPISSTLGSTYQVQNCVFEDLLTTMQGAGIVALKENTFANITCGGDQPMGIVRNTFANLTINDTAEVSLTQCQRSGSVTGTGKIAEDLFSGLAEFVAAATVSVLLPVTQINDNYQVLPESNTGTFVGVQNKSDIGFDLTFPSGATTAAVVYRVVRDQ